MLFIKRWHLKLCVFDTDTEDGGCLGIWKEIKLRLYEGYGKSISENQLMKGYSKNLII